ncbi:MAG: cell division protein FtsZ [bacterium]
MIGLDNQVLNSAKIRVIGVGGCGGNAINNMIEKNLTGVSFISANTDKQVLDTNLAQMKLQIGKETTRGLGAGGDPEVGRISAEENIEEIKESLLNSDMVFVTAGMGGGTGTGAAPIIAKAARDMDALVVAVVTKPFSWEGKRAKIAEDGINELKQFVDALITIPNQKLLEITDKKVTFKQSYMIVDDVLYNATRGISDIITKPGLVNVDFADVRSVMKGQGDALMGIGIASGENRAIEATKNALNSPLLENVSIAGAQGVLVNITGNEEITGLHEIAQAIAMIEECAGPEVNLIHGVVLVSEPMEELMVTVVATGFNNKAERPKMQRPALNLGFKEKDMFNLKPKQVSDISFDRKVETIPEKVAIPMGRQVSPRGEDELKKLDVPTFIRRLGNPEEQNSLNTDQAVQNSAEKVPAGLGFDKAASLKNYDQPAFLRKIMD